MDVNNLKELKEKNKHALIDDIDFFRAKNKAKRDRWVVCQFLTILGISFKENELEVPNTDPPDIVYKEAQFEIKEIMDQARKRHTEYKDELLRLDSIKDPSEIFRLYTPKGLTPQNIVDITLSELKNMNISMIQQLKMV